MVNCSLVSGFFVNSLPTFSIPVMFLPFPHLFCRAYTTLSRQWTSNLRHFVSVSSLKTSLAPRIRPHLYKWKHTLTFMPTLWHIYAPSTIPILTLTGSIQHLFCWGAGERGRGWWEVHGFHWRGGSKHQQQLPHWEQPSSGESRTAATEERRMEGWEGREGDTIDR